MTRLHLIPGLLAAALLTPLAGTCAADDKAQPRQRGRVKVEVARPDHFPTRIWASCDFEGRTPDYAWFGPAEKKQRPA